MKTTAHTTRAAPARRSASQGLRLLAVTAAVALSAGLLQTAQAMPGGHGGGGMGMMMASPRHMDRMLDGIQATPEQRAQLQQIFGAARQELQAQRQQGQSLREQAAALWSQPSVDARAAEALRQQMQARQDQASKRMLQAMLEASRVLSPEQRQQLAERANKRGAMAKRHHQERRSLEANPGR
jgi:Spy/CpxP family protein refolding chaperone